MKRYGLYGVFTLIMLTAAMFVAYSAGSTADRIFASRRNTASAIEENDKAIRERFSPISYRPAFSPEITPGSRSMPFVSLGGDFVYGELFHNIEIHPDTNPSDSDILTLGRYIFQSDDHTQLTVKMYLPGISEVVAEVRFNGFGDSMRRCDVSYAEYLKVQDKITVYSLTE